MKIESFQAIVQKQLDDFVKDAKSYPDFESWSEQTYTEWYEHFFNFLENIDFERDYNELVD